MVKSIHRNLALAALTIFLALAAEPVYWAVRAASNTCTTCYIDHVNGSDSNDGTTETTGGGHGPWKHAPGMLGLSPTGTSTGDGCTANCASQVPVAGDKYILKGGVVWPYTTMPWSWGSASGTSSTQTYGCAGTGCIYVGNAVGAGLPAWNAGVVNSVVMTRDLGGWNPASPPTITLSGGGGSGAAATPNVMPAAQSDPNVAGFIYHVTLTSGGSGYTSAPSCSISGGGGTGTCAADIDRAIIDDGALQASPPDWPCGLASNSWNHGPINYGAGSYVIFNGLEVRDLWCQTSASRGPIDMLGGIGPHSTASNNYVHGEFVDCVTPASGAPVAVTSPCPTSGAGYVWPQDNGIDPYGAYSEAANNIVEDGDSFVLGTSTTVSNNYCGLNGACIATSFGIEMSAGTAGPSSVHGNKIYSGAWLIRQQGNATANPFLAYNNEVWLALYAYNPSFHVNRRYSQLSTGTTLYSYNNIDHNHVAAASNQQQCAPSQSLYFFNEVIWAQGGGTPPYGINTTSPAVGGCAAYFFNDTIYNAQSSQGYVCLNSNSTATNATTVVMQNLHCITGPSVVNPFWGSGYTNITYEDYAGSSVAANVQAASVVQGISTANAQGYTLLNLYAPTSASGATVPFATGGNSANLSALCSGYLVPLCSDINGVPRGPNWQAGAYVSQSLLPPVSSRTLQ